MSVRYAAFGSNLHPLRLGKRLASATLCGTAFLPDWSLEFHKRSTDGSGKCSIRRGSSGVHLAIYDMDDSDRILLDRIEGLGAGYDDVNLDVPGFGGCFSYTAAATHVDDTLSPYDWYSGLVVAGARFHDFPRNYIDRIVSVATTRDPDAERHRLMWDLVESIEVQGLHLARQRIAPPAE